MEREFCPFIARYRLANERWVALDALKTPAMLRYKEAVAEQARAWSQAGYVVDKLAATWSNISGLIAQSWYRWTKYSLLVEAIIAHTGKGDPDYQRLEEAKQMLKLANARINDLGGRWTVIGALLSGKGIEGAVATRSNTGVKFGKTPLMTRLFKKPEIENDPGQELEDHLRRLRMLDSGTIDLIDNTRAWFDAAAECMDSALLSVIHFADSAHGHRDEHWRGVFLAMTEYFEMARSNLASLIEYFISTAAILTTLQETTFEGTILPNIEELRHSMNGPSTVLDAAFKMQRQYIAGMDYEAEGAKNVFETYAEICAQLGDEIPKYLGMYLKGMFIVVLRLSTAQAAYYDDISKAFEMVFKEKGLEGDREGYRRDRPNGSAPKLRAFSVYRAIAEDRLPGSKELGYGSYGCDGEDTRQLWEEGAGEYLSRLGTWTAAVEDRVKEYCEGKKRLRGESASNTSVSSLLSRLTNKGKVSIGSRSTPALNEIRASPISSPPDSPPVAWFNVGQRSPSSPTLASLPAHGNPHPHQGSTERVVPIAPAIQRTMTAPSTMGLSHSPPVRAQFTRRGHHRSRSHGYPLAINKSLPGIPSSSEGLVTGIPASPPAVPPRPLGGHRRQCSEGQVVMKSLRLGNRQPAVPFSNPAALRNQPGDQPASAQPVTVVASVARPITKQLVKSNLTPKLRDHHQVSSRMQPAKAPSSIARQYPPHATQGRSKSQPRAHHQPQAEAEYTPVMPLPPLRLGVSSAHGNQASTSNSHP